MKSSRFPALGGPLLWEMCLCSGSGQRGNGLGLGGWGWPSCTRGSGGHSTQVTPRPGLSPQPPPLPTNAPALEMRPRMLPVFFGEGIAVNPEPAHEIR